MTATASHGATSQLYPPAIAPPPAPLPVWKFLPTFLRNPLRAIPEPVYHEPLFSPPSLGGRLAWVTDPALVEQVLLAQHESFPKSPIEKRIFGAMLGDGILTSEGAMWRWQRRTVAPLFRHADLLAQVPAMSAAAERMAASWRRTGPIRHRPIDRDMTDLTFDVLQATLFEGANAAEAAVLKEQTSAYLERTSWDIAYEMLRVPAWVWHPGQRPMKRAARKLNDTIFGVIARERQAGWPSGGLMARLGRATDPETGEPMQDGQIAHNLLTFAAAGHETTAKALTWTLYLLARSPEWQDRLREEASRVAGLAPVASEHIDALHLTRQVLKESMRLYPPAPVIGRMAKQAVTLGGLHFQPGTLIIIPIYIVHRHRKLWRDPNLFDPARFSPEQEKLHARTQFMPFGFGPRTCIGMSFAMIEATALLASLVRSARFTCDASLAPEPVSRVTLRPKGGMPLHIDMRT